MFNHASKRAVLFRIAVLVAIQSFSGVSFAQTERVNRARQVSTAPAAEATLILNEQFLNSFRAAQGLKERVGMTAHASA